MSRRDRDKAAARRRAAVQRATAATGSSAKDQARARVEALAAIAPSAALVVVTGPQGTRAVDPVVTALGFARDLLSLQGSGSKDARERASLVHRALGRAVPHVLPSGSTLAEALDVTDVPADEHDGEVTVAVHLAELGKRHDTGEVDLYARVAPPGLGRHPAADEIDLVCSAVVPEDVAADPLAPRLVLSDGEGWFSLWPAAALEAKRLGVLDGRVGDVVGAGLLAWLTGPSAAAMAADGPDALPAMFGGRDVMAAVQMAQRSAGSDHPSVAGPVLLDLLAPA